MSRDQGPPDDELSRYLRRNREAFLRAQAEMAGYGDQWAIEIYPAEDETVNVANMRHLWLMAEAPSVAWRRKE